MSGILTFLGGAMFGACVGVFVFALIKASDD